MYLCWSCKRCTPGTFDSLLRNASAQIDQGVQREILGTTSLTCNSTFDQYTSTQRNQSWSPLGTSAQASNAEGWISPGFQSPHPLDHEQTSVYRNSQDLRFWAEHRSWAYCTRCAFLQSKKLLPAYRKQTKPTSSKSCTCSTGRYQVPHPRRVPAVLQNLTMDEIYALPPFRAFSGQYTRMMFGYRMREEPFKIKVKIATSQIQSRGKEPELPSTT